MTSYRIRLCGERTHYVDILADSPLKATAEALKTHRNCWSAKCMGTTEELTERGREPGRYYTEAT
jgi:hypothetical protein